MLMMSKALTFLPIISNNIEIVQLLMEYATQGLENNLFVSKYQLYLPNREQLQKELEDLLEDDKD